MIVNVILVHLPGILMENWLISTATNKKWTSNKIIKISVCVYVCCSTDAAMAGSDWKFDAFLQTVFISLLLLLLLLQEILLIQILEHFIQMDSETSCNAKSNKSL